jgi:hypothetical protein
MIIILNGFITIEGVSNAKILKTPKLNSKQEKEVKELVKKISKGAKKK